MQEADETCDDGVRLRPHHYVDREPWTCLDSFRDTDYDLHWERRTRKQGGSPPRGGGLDPSTSTPACAARDDVTPVTVDEKLSGLDPSLAFGNRPGLTGVSVGLSQTAASAEPNPVPDTVPGAEGLIDPTVPDIIVDAESQVNSTPAVTRPERGLRRRSNKRVGGKEDSRSGGRCGVALGGVVDERAVWVTQRLSISGGHNLLSCNSGEGDPDEFDASTPPTSHTSAPALKKMLPKRGTKRPFAPKKDVRRGDAAATRTKTKRGDNTAARKTIQRLSRDDSERRRGAIHPTSILLLIRCSK